MSVIIFIAFMVLLTSNFVTYSLTKSRTKKSLASPAPKAEIGGSKKKSYDLLNVEDRTEFMKEQTKKLLPPAPTGCVWKFVVAKAEGEDVRFDDIVLRLFIDDMVTGESTRVTGFMMTHFIDGRSLYDRNMSNEAIAELYGKINPEAIAKAAARHLSERAAKSVVNKEEYVLDD